MHTPQRQGATWQAVLCCVLLGVATAQAAAPSFSYTQSSSVNNTRTKTVNIGSGAVIGATDFSTDYQVSQNNSAVVTYNANLPPPPSTSRPPSPPPAVDTGCGAFGCSPPPPNAPTIPGIQVSFDVKTSSNTTNTIDNLQVANLAGSATPAIGNSIDADQNINNAVSASTNVAVLVNSAPSIGSGRITGKDTVQQSATNAFTSQQGVQGGDAQGSNVATVKQAIAISANGVSSVYVGQKTPTLPPFPPSIRFTSPPPAPSTPPPPPSTVAGAVTNGNTATVKQSINSNLTHNVFHTVDLTGTGNVNTVNAKGTFAFNAQANSLNQVANQQVMTGTNSASTAATNNYTAIQTAENNVTKFDTTEATYGNRTSDVRYSSVTAGNQVNKGTNIQTINGVNGGTVRNTKTDLQDNQNWMFVSNGLQVSLVNSTQQANVNVAINKGINQGNAAANKQEQTVDSTFTGTSTSSNVADQSNSQGLGSNYLTGNQVQVFGGDANAVANVNSNDVTDTQQVNTGTQQTTAGTGISGALSGSGGTVAQKATYNQSNVNFANYTTSNAAVILDSKGAAQTKVTFGSGGQIGTVAGQSNEVFQNQDASSSTKGSGGGSISQTINDEHQNELNVKFLGVNYVGVTNSSGVVDNTVNTLLASSQKSNRIQTQVGGASNTAGTTGKAQATASTNSGTFNTYDTQYTSAQTVNTTNQGATGTQLVDTGFTDVNNQNAQAFQYSENQAKGSTAAGTSISYSNVTGANAATTSNANADPASATVFGQFANSGNTGNVTQQGGQIVQQYQTIATNDYQQGTANGGSATNAFGATSNDANAIHYNDNVQDVSVAQFHNINNNKGNVNLGTTGGQLSNQISGSNATQVGEATGGSKRNAAAQVSNRLGNPLQGSDPTNKYYTLTNGNANYLGSLVRTVTNNNTGNVNFEAINEQVNQQTNVKGAYQQGSQNGFLASRVGKGTVNVADKSAQYNYNGVYMDNTAQLETNNNSGTVTNDQGYQIGNVQSNAANLLQSGITNTGGQNVSNSANLYQENVNGLTEGQDIQPGDYNKNTRLFVGNSKNNTNSIQSSSSQGSQINLLAQSQNALAPSTGPGKVQQTLNDQAVNNYANGQAIVYQTQTDGNTAVQSSQSSSGNFQQGNVVQQEQVTYVVPQRTARPLTVTQTASSNVLNTGDNRMGNLLGTLTVGNATNANFNVEQGSSQAGVQRNRYNGTQLAQASSLAGQFGVVDNQAAHTSVTNKTANNDGYLINAVLQGINSSATVSQLQDLVDNQENNQTTTQLGVGVAFAGASGYAKNKATTKQNALDVRQAEAYALVVDVSGNATSNTVTQGGSYVVQQVKAGNASQVAGGSGGFNRFAVGNSSNTLTTNQLSNYTLVKNTQQAFVNNNTQNTINTGTANEVYVSDQDDKIEQNGAALGAGSVSGKGMATNTAFINRNDQNYLNITHQAVADNSGNGVVAGPRAATPPTTITSSTVSVIAQGGNSSTNQNSYGYGGGPMKAKGNTGNATNRITINGNNRNSQTFQHVSVLASAIKVPPGKTVGSILSNSVTNLGNATVKQDAQAPGYAPKTTYGGGSAVNAATINVSNTTSTTAIFNVILTGIQNGTINNSTSNAAGNGTGNLGGVTNASLNQKKIAKVPFPPPPKKRSPPPRRPPPPKRSPPKKKSPPPKKKSPPPRKSPPPKKKSPPPKSTAKRPPPPKKSTGRRLMYI